MTPAQYKKLRTIAIKATNLEAELVLTDEKYDMRQITDRILIMLRRHENGGRT